MDVMCKGHLYEEEHGDKRGAEQPGKGGGEEIMADNFYWAECPQDSILSDLSFIHKEVISHIGVI